MEPFLSACIIAKNEERTIERAVKSVAFADEIVVVDSGSVDRTCELASKNGARVVTNAWRGFAEQRNFGLSQCRGKWVFFLDADEAASGELGKILKSISGDAAERHPNCYSIKRIEYFLGKELHYGPGNPSFQWRFFKRAAVKYSGEVHEYPKFEGGVGLIEAPIHHNPNLNVERFLNKLNHYTSLEALDRFRQGQKTTLFHAFGTFFTTMLKNGVRYRGFLNGKEGFVLTVLESFSRVVRHFKLWMLWQVHSGRIKIDLGMKLPNPGSQEAPKLDEIQKPRWKSPN